jgi:hypothetical protein
MDKIAFRPLPQKSFSTASVLCATLHKVLRRADVKPPDEEAPRENDARHEGPRAAAPKTLFLIFVPVQLETEKAFSR